MMSVLHSFLVSLKKFGKYPLYFLGSILLILWWIATPPGIFGKAGAIGYAVCHRIDVRSFHLGIQQLPLCARCTGQYVGAMLGIVFQAVFSRRRSGFPPRRVLPILGLLLLVYAVDGINSYLHMPVLMNVFPSLRLLYEPTNTLRLFTGTGMGLVLALIIYPAFVGSVYTRPDNRPAIGGVKPVLLLVGLGFIADLLILTGSAYVLYPAALLSTAGVIILLSFAYTTLVLRILRQENTFERFFQVSLPLYIGFIITVIQIALFDLIRYLVTGAWGGLVL